MSRRHLATLLTVSGLILGGFVVPSYGQQPQSCQIGRSVIIAVNSARTGNDVSIPSGDVVVNQAVAGPTLGNGFSLYIDRKTSIAGSIKADKIRIFAQATIGGSASFNVLTNDGAIAGGQVTPLTLPVFSTLPAFHNATFRGDVQNVNVAAGATTVLIPRGVR